MADTQPDQLRQELQDLDVQIAEVRATLDDLRALLGGQADGPQDAEDVAASLTSIEEQEGVLDALEHRRERLVGQLGG